MPRAKAVLYSITRQLRSYEPTRIEVTVERGDDEPHLTDDELIVRARDLCELAMEDAIARFRSGANRAM